MEVPFLLFVLILLNGANLLRAVKEEGKKDLKQMLPDDLSEELPTVQITLLVRNKAHVLPFFLSCLENLDYPKDRLSLWIRSDHNEDNSVELLQLWLNQTSSLYHNVDFSYDDATQHYPNATSVNDWTTARFRQIIQLKEEAMLNAQKIWADFIFFLDADVLLTGTNTLRHLTQLRLPIVAPMLLSEGLYSNFWCGMSNNYYYQRTDEYKEIYNVRKEGNFPVPMVHSALLVNLNYRGSRYLTFDREHLIEQQINGLEWNAKAGGNLCRPPYDGPLDDIIVFAISANCSKIPMFISNDIPYGYILQPLERDDSLQQDMQQLMNIKANIVHDLGEPLAVNSIFTKHVNYPEKHKLTLDKIYMINLERRPERRHKMELLFKELGLDVEHFAAVDGKTLDLKTLQEMNIEFLKGYEDPYHQRQMTMGEVGCFLSHYRIWQEIVNSSLQEVLILEDDIRFEPYFNQRVISILKEARNVVEYDLIYFGRKRLKEENEPWVVGAEHLVHVGYSYWTLGYVVSLQGAKKLIAAQPLKNLLPVDEYLPLMFNRHPNKTWVAAYPVRNLIAFSAAPLLLFPTHYTGDMGYISDTEDSELTSEPSHNLQSAQLKSDREREFYMQENIYSRDEGSTNKLDDFMNFENMLKHEMNNIAKPHEEL